MVWFLVSFLCLAISLCVSPCGVSLSFFLVLYRSLTHSHQAKHAYNKNYINDQTLGTHVANLGFLELVDNMFCTLKFIYIYIYTYFLFKRKSLSLFMISMYMSHICKEVIVSVFKKETKWRPYNKKH